jgi:hypothetical protein
MALILKKFTIDLNYLGRSTGGSGSKTSGRHAPSSAMMVRNPPIKPVLYYVDRKLILGNEKK